MYESFFDNFESAQKFVGKNLVFNSLDKPGQGEKEGSPVYLLKLILEDRALER